MARFHVKNFNHTLSGSYDPSSTVEGDMEEGSQGIRGSHAFEFKFSAIAIGPLVWG